MTPSLSIVIPTHKRADILKECLRRIEAQTAKEALEVIVVSDGRDAKTDELFAKESFQVPLTYFSIEKSQQGTARNRGTERAKGEIVLFIGDDIFLEKDACEKHLKTHASASSSPSPVAVLGHITWDPSLNITPVMRWLERTGWQFGFPFLRDFEGKPIPPAIQHRFTYTSHISLRTEIAKAHPFREDLFLYGWEDVEWGLRLKEAGVRLFYDPAARALHHHRMTMDESLKRMETLGKSAVTVQRIAPRLKAAPTGWKQAAYRAFSLLPTLRGRHARAFLRGISGAASG